MELAERQCMTGFSQPGHRDLGCELLGKGV